MADKLIYCHKCGRYVGTLKEGSTTMVGLTYTCPRCFQPARSSESITEMFAGIFDNIKYKR